MEVQVHLLLLLSVIISSNAETVENLTGIEGGSITFPQPVFQRGFLIYGGGVIASVTERKAEILEDSWKDKVHWNNTTGFFTITRLQTNNSGIYSVDAIKVIAVYKLTVFVIISSTAETVENLTGIEGGSITFPQPVFQHGFLIYGGGVIAMVTEGQNEILRDSWKDKVHWNNTTGIFTITELQTNDSGIYSVNVIKGVKKGCRLTVFESISILPVVRVNVTTESCTLLCVVEKPAGTTIWWSKDEEKVKQSSSSLSLPLTIITQEFNSSCKCEAATSAENKSLEVIVTALCSEDKNSEDENTNQTNVGTTVVLPIVLTILVLAVLAGFFIKWKRSKKGQSTEDTQSKEPEAHYSEIDFVRSQERASPRPTRPVDQSLTTIYAKLEVHNQDRDTSC